MDDPADEISKRAKTGGRFVDVMAMEKLLQ
jgi:hypothetical protein